MKALRIFSIVIASLLLGMAFGGPAKAALEWEFTASGPDMKAEGVIQFAIDECLADCLDDVVDFRIEGTTFDHAYTCEGVSCLEAAVWEILPDWELGFINLQTLGITTSPPVVTVDFIFNSGLASSSVCVDPMFASCGPGGEFGIADAEEFEATPVHVPEPSTLTLFAGGLAGLLGWAWRRRRKTV